MTNMKGITPVIAIILLLLITISMVGFAWVWFGQVSQRLTTDIENRTFEQINRQEKTIRIDNANGVNIDIRATGSSIIQISEIQVYVDDIRQTCDWGGLTSVAPAAVETCVIPACTAGQTIRATSPGGTDEVLCT